MFAFAMRRALWAVPTLFGVSIVVFLLTTLLPDPSSTEPASADPDARIQAEERRRVRFLDLPRFFNADPHDVRHKVDVCVESLAHDTPDAALCERRLAQMGGAALPYLIPRLDRLGPAARGRVARALLPVAQRMGIPEVDAEMAPDRAALFWAHFWEDRSIDFTEPAVNRSVKRLAQRGTDLREQDLKLVDTFALEQMVAAMKTTRDPEALQRLTRVASHVSGKDLVLKDAATRTERRAIVSEWQSWWYVHGSDYVALDGPERVAASISETRYAKWVLGAATGQLGLSTRDGVPVVDKLLDRAVVTFTMAFLALLVSFAVAVPIGVVGAWRRGSAVDHALAFVMLLVYSIPTFIVAHALHRWTGNHVVAPILALATVSMSTMSQQQRASMIDALAQDYIRVARGKGVGPVRVAVVHALRNALLPTVTLSGLQVPALIGAAFVVEEVFGIRGMGWETLRAIEAHDVAFVVAMTLLSALATTLFLVASEVAYGLLDPRVRESQTRRRRA
jgi:peptide/nickel transport system permease protein